MALRRCTVPPKLLLPFLCATLFAIQLGMSLSDLPSVRLMQDIVCRRHYGIDADGLLPDEQCRADVQRDLNSVTMGISVAVTAASALVAFPLGTLADRVGRVPVLGLSILSIFLSQGYAMYICWQWNTIPLRAVWAMAAPLLLGGGRSVAEAIIFTIIVDVVPDKKRAAWFQSIVAAVLASQLLGPFLAGRLMTPSVWLPLWLSMGLIWAGGILVVALTPETLPRKGLTAHDTGDEPSVASPRATCRVVFSRPAIYLLPGALLTVPVASTQSDTLLRFMPLQFHWTLAKSALLTSLRSLATLVTLLLLLPGAACLCSKKAGWQPLRRDRVLARASTFFFLLGSLGLIIITKDIFVIVGVAVSALGSGSPILCRSMLVALAGKHNSASLFGILAVGEVVGFLACVMGMGWLFNVGLTSWMGLPFCLAVLASLGVFVATWALPSLKGYDSVSENSDGETERTV